MKGKTGNLIQRLKEGDAIQVDGPARIVINKIKRNKVVILIDGDDDTDIKRIIKTVEELDAIKAVEIHKNRIESKDAITGANSAKD